ncbi:TnsA-like heteromeric transposase endonuclease subunit [Streptomyces sp. NPDC001586]|uniref:TnsA-like heteromeric transposase endonuclease subunit n=1 Tax=unclassified Streptomyces TaxID=2593676 RepID=UPI003330CA68
MRRAGDVVGVPAQAIDQAALAAFELDFSVDGVRRRRLLGSSWDVRFEEVEPVREFAWHRYTRGFAGWYYSATVRDHVGYESWLERDRLVLLDRDPQVVGIASQPFWLHWDDGSRGRRHAPDYFVRLADGGARVVDVRAEDDLDEETKEAFAATEHACRAVGWEFVWAGRPDPVFMANVRWLARYRRTRCGRPTEVAARLLEVFREPKDLWEGAGLVGDRLRVLPVLFHLLWSGALETDLAGSLMQTDSVVWTEGSGWAS